jgi:uncharacterized protein with HEPN domain
MSLLIVGEAAAKVMDLYPDFAEKILMFNGKV